MHYWGKNKWTQEEEEVENYFSTSETQEWLVAIMRSDLIRYSTTCSRDSGLNSGFQLLGRNKRIRCNTWTFSNRVGGNNGFVLLKRKQQGNFRGSKMDRGLLWGPPCAIKDKTNLGSVAGISFSPWLPGVIAKHRANKYVLSTAWCGSQTKTSQKLSLVFAYLLLC